MGLARILQVQWTFLRHGRLLSALRGFPVMGERLLGRLAPNRARTCNICGWRGRRFLTAYYYDQVRRGVFCPQCGCAERHRTLKLVLERRFGEFFRSKRRRVLDIAPIVQARQLFPAAAMDYCSFDLVSPLARVRGDLCRACFPDACFDFILCAHVIEHISDESGALREIHRMLRPGGAAVLQVPWDPSAARTVEYEKPRLSEEGHVRRYGRDVEERWRRAGFVTEFAAPAFEPDLVARHGLETEVAMIVHRR